MSLDFLNNACKEKVRYDVLFGLCDNQDSTKAYSTLANPDSWVATVKNDNKIGLTFTPIDKCLIQDHEYPNRGRCDGLLTSDVHLYFVELKDQAKGWITGAVEQLDSTIEFFKEAHDINKFKHKKAFACNKQHGHFQEIDNESNLAFFKKHRVRLDVQAEVLII